METVEDWTLPCCDVCCGCHYTLPEGFRAVLVDGCYVYCSQLCAASDRERRKLQQAAHADNTRRMGRAALRLAEDLETDTGTAAAVLDRLVTEEAVINERD